jgi:hypothetical protein
MGNISFIPIIGKALMSMSHKMPVESEQEYQWSQPSGDAGDHYDNHALQPEDYIAIPTCIPPMFEPQDMHSYFQDSCNEIGQLHHDFHDAALDGLDFAINVGFRLMAKFKDLQVASVSAIGSPGCLDGPEIENDVKNSPGMAAMSGNEGKYRDAVAAGVSSCWANWADNVTVPGLPWYPAFAAYPGPMAPPTPNVPMPLIACVSSGMADITVPSTLKDAMVDELDGGIKDDDPDKHHETLFDAIGTVFALGALIWLAAQQVMNVLGKGPVPSFAPPYVPVGPVVGGDNIGIPGHLAA